MYPVSPRFLASIAVSHRVAVRVRVFDRPRFGVSPDGGTVLPLIAGDVRMSSTSDIKASAALTVPGGYWEQVQPFGAEVFIERGINYGDGETEYVPLGYFRIDRAEQQEAPYGPVQLACVDRIAQLQQNRVLRPYQVPDGTTHRQIFQRLVNGNGGAGQSTAGYGMFLFDEVPISWTSYNPDAARIYGGHVVEDDAYEYLAKLVDGRGCVLRFDEAGGLVVGPRDGDPAGPPVYAITTGTGGNLVRASRSVSREGVYNVVSAYGSDPANPTGYQLAYNDDESSPLFWQGPFGVAPRFYASPVIRNSAAADAAAESVLARYTALPSVLSLHTVPNPALRPLDVVTATYDPDVAETHVVDELTVPLVGDAPVQVSTRPANSPPSQDLQLDPPGDGVQPFMGGTLGSYDPDTGANSVNVGGTEYSNLPVSGCCDFGGGDFGGQVMLGYTDAGPFIMGPLASFPSEDPVQPDWAGYDQFGGGSGGYDQLYATPQVREVLTDRLTAPPSSATDSITLTTSDAVQVGDLLVLFHGITYGLNGALATNDAVAPSGGGWTSHTVLRPAVDGGFNGEASGFIVIWTRAVTVGGAQSFTVLPPGPVHPLDGFYDAGHHTHCYVLAGPGLTVVGAASRVANTAGAAETDAVAPSTAGARGGLLITGWVNELEFDAPPHFTPPTVPASMSDRTETVLVVPLPQTFQVTARETLTGAGATGTRTATGWTRQGYFGGAAIVVRGAPR